MKALRGLPWILTGLLWLMTSPAAWAQSDDEDSPPPAAETPTEEGEDDDRDPLIRDGVFRPSEEIEADSEISFPADI